MTAARRVLIFLKTSGPQCLISITSVCHWLDSRQVLYILEQFRYHQREWPLGTRRSSARFSDAYCSSTFFEQRPIRKVSASHLVRFIFSYLLLFNLSYLIYTCLKYFLHFVLRHHIFNMGFITHKYFFSFNFYIIHLRFFFYIFSIRSILFLFEHHI